jgi:hypothetical protein
MARFSRFPLCTLRSALRVFRVFRGKDNFATFAVLSPNFVARREDFL